MRDGRRILSLKWKLIVSACLAAVLAVAYLLRSPCPFYSAFHLPCITCGMTHAYLALLRLDIVGAFGYHPMFWSIPVLYAFFLLDGRVFKRTWLNRAVIFGICALLVAWWIYSVCSVILP